MQKTGPFDNHTHTTHYSFSIVRKLHENTRNLRNLDEKFK